MNVGLGMAERTKEQVSHADRRGRIDLTNR